MHEFQDQIENWYRIMRHTSVLSLWCLEKCTKIKFPKVCMDLWTTLPISNNEKKWIKMNHMLLGRNNILLSTYNGKLTITFKSNLGILVATKRGWIFGILSLITLGRIDNNQVSITTRNTTNHNKLMKYKITFYLLTL